MKKNASLIFINGNVLTLDDRDTRAGSIAISDGKIIGVWNSSEPPRDEVRMEKETKVIDLEGKTIIPGFIDTHNHILWYALNKAKVNCSTPPNKNIEDILQAIEKKVKDSSPGEWIEGFGYDDTLLAEKRHPTKEDLDKVAPEHPVYIEHISSHFGVANSQALELSGLTDVTPNPPGGHFGRNENGELDGVLYELDAMEAVRKFIPQKSKEEKIELLEKAAKEYVGVGITTNTDAAVEDLDSLEVHLEAAKNRENPMRTQLMIMHYLLRKDGPFGYYTREELDTELQKRSEGLARLDSAKLFQDGSIQGMTGALRKPYYNDPIVIGDLIHEEGAFQEEVLHLHQRGFRVTIHGNGDRAIGSILDAYEYALETDPREDHRHRIEHVQSGTTRDLEKMNRLNVAGSFFINHVYYWGDRHESIFLGPERGRRISPLKEAVDHQLLFTLHSDCPVTPISPLFSVWIAVNRKTRDGKVLGPEQRIDVLTALKAMTIYGAKLIFREDELGSIEVGKLADLAILDCDPTAVESDEIKDIEVEATYVGGEVVFEKG